MVYLFKVVAEYAESILTCTENSFKDFERIWRMCQEYFAKHGEYADKQKIEPTSVNFRPKQKKSDPKSPSYRRRERMGKKPSHATIPLRR